MSDQLLQFLSSNDPAFRANYPTERALTKVVNDLLLAIDSDTKSVLLLLDLSAAFDTVEHVILLDRLEN